MHTRKGNRTEIYKDTIKPVRVQWILLGLLYFNSPPHKPSVSLHQKPPAPLPHPIIQHKSLGQPTGKEQFKDRRW